MRKSLFNSILAGTMAVLLISACTEDKDSNQKNKDTSLTAPVKILKTKARVPKTTTSRDNRHLSIMDQPVNFSTPEDVEYTLLTIRDKEGERAYKKIKSAMGYIMTYDLSVGHSEAKMHKKLNGKTPNEIIDQMKR